MTEKRFNVKYWQTNGIEEVEGEMGDTYFCVGDGWSRIWLKPGLEVFETRDEAVTKFEQLREKKLKGLTRQIERIKNLKP